MLSKEEILMYVQQGQAQPDWQVLRPNTSYLVKQVLSYAVIALFFLGAGAYVIRQDSFAFGAVGLVNIGSLQTWHTIDEVVVAIGALAFLWLTGKYILDLNTIKNQMLVLLPEGFFLKKRSTK